MPNTLQHRYHLQLEQYWNSLRGTRPFPLESEVNPDEISDLWPSCFLVSIDDVTRRVGYRYSYLGEELIKAYGEDANHPDTVLRLLAAANAPMARKFDEVVKYGKPVIDESTFINLKHLDIKYRTCLLPLGTGDGMVTHVLGCMRWRAY